MTAKSDEWRRRDALVVNRPWSNPKGEPVVVTKAKGSTVTDADGNQFVDFTSGYFVNNAGHCHPTIAKAVTEQMSKVLQVSGKFATPASIELAEELVTLTPPSTNKVFYATGGSEAIEFAFKMVRQKTGRENIGYLANGYHGLTLGALAACAAKKYRDTGAAELPGNTFELPNAYCYRCQWKDNCQTQCLDGLDAQLAEEKPAAIVGEPIQAVGGIRPPKQWWERVDEIRRKHKSLLILDEIQTGLGRTGTMFAAEHFDLEPDVLTAGKGLSGGVGSLAVAVASDEVAKDFYAGTTPTSGGNAVSAVAGSTLIKVIAEEKLLENCTAMGNYFTEIMWGLDDPWVGDVRFSGLLGGVELVVDKSTAEPVEKSVISKIRDGLYDSGMLVTTTGPLGNCLRLQPPLCITKSELDAFAEALRKVLEDVRG